MSCPPSEHDENSGVSACTQLHMMRQYNTGDFSDVAFSLVKRFFFLMVYLCYLTYL